MEEVIVCCACLKERLKITTCGNYKLVRNAMSLICDICYLTKGMQHAVPPELFEDIPEEADLCRSH